MNKLGIVALNPTQKPSTSRVEAQKTTASFDEKVKIETADLLLSSSGQYGRWQRMRQNNDTRLPQVADSLLERHHMLMAHKHGTSVDWERFDTLTRSLSRSGIHLYKSRSFQKSDQSVALKNNPANNSTPNVVPPSDKTLSISNSEPITRHSAPPVLQNSQAFIPPVVSSPKVSTASLLSDENSLIFNLLCDSIGLQETAFGYGDDNVTLLPLGEITTAFDFKIDVDPASGKAKGWFISEDRSFLLDSQQQSIQIGGQSIPWKEGTVFVHDGEIYVDSETLSSWLPLDFDISRSELTVSVTPREKLPIQAAMERDLRRLRLSSKGDEGLKYPLRKLEYEFASFPVVDMSMSGGLGSENLESAGLESRYSLLARGDLLYMNSHVYFSGFESDPLETARVRLDRFSPEADLLGFMHARQIGVGDIIPTHFPILTDPTPERGAYVSNSNMVRSSNFDTTTFEGNILPGWEVELYYNDELIDSSRVRGDGRYYFENVPLFYGNNDFKILAYGPQGQKEILEESSIPVGPGMLPLGGSQYDMSLSQRKKTILGFEDNDLAQQDNSPRLRGKYKYGVTDSLSLASGIASLEFDGERHNYLQLGLAGSTSFLYGQADYLYDTASGSGLSLLVQTGLGPFNLKAKHEWFSDFIMENRPESILTSKTEVDLNGTIPKSSIFPAVSFTVSSENTEYTNSSIANLSGRVSTSIARMRLNNVTRWYYSGADYAGKAPVDGTFQASGTIGPVRVLGGIDYDLGDESKITRYSLSNHWPINDRLSGGLDIVKDADYFDRTTASAKLDWDAGLVTVSPRLSYDTDNNYGAFLTLSFSFGLDSSQSGMAMSSQKHANDGSVQAFVYHDANNNKMFDGGDTPLPDVQVLAAQSRVVAETKKGGEAVITGLPAYRSTDIEIDVETLEDPFWQPSMAGTAVMPRPGHVDYIEFPVVSTGEIDGTLYSVNKQGAKYNLANVRLELLDAEGAVVQTIRSEYDGFYLFEKVFPGEYVLRIASEKFQDGELAGNQEIRVTIGNDGTIVSGNDIFLQEPGGGRNQKPAVKTMVGDLARIDLDGSNEKERVGEIPRSKELLHNAGEEAVAFSQEPVQQFRPIATPVQPIFQEPELLVSSVSTEKISLPETEKIKSAELKIRQEKVVALQDRMDSLEGVQKGVNLNSKVSGGRMTPFEVLSMPIESFQPLVVEINTRKIANRVYRKQMEDSRSQAVNSYEGQAILRGMV